MKRFLLAALLAAPLTVDAFCPSFTASSPNNTGNCSTNAAPGTNPTVSEWNVLFDKLSKGETHWAADGVPWGTLGQGCGKPQAPKQVPAYIPCELFKAMTMQESSWRQFCVPDRPSDQVGKPSQTIIAFDCGYGVSQVTSGMRKNETPDYIPQRVAAEPFYNLAVGGKIFVSKWRVTKCIGDNQPHLLEHWYSAVWAYNGLSYKNNPNNPTYSSTRSIYNPKVGGSAPYQEKVWGWVMSPPTPSHWTSLSLAYPDLMDIGGASAPNAMKEPSCATPTSCTQQQTVHRTLCGAPAPTPPNPPPPTPPDPTPSDPSPKPDAGIETVPLDEPLLFHQADGRWPEASEGGCSISGDSGFLLLAAWGFWRKRKPFLPK